VNFFAFSFVFDEPKDDFSFPGFYDFIINKNQIEFIIWSYIFFFNVNRFKMVAIFHNDSSYFFCINEMQIQSKMIFIWPKEMILNKKEKIFKFQSFYLSRHQIQRQSEIFES
jgi:hypothetical protein